MAKVTKLEKLPGCRRVLTSAMGDDYCSPEELRFSLDGTRLIAWSDEHAEHRVFDVANDTVVHGGGGLAEMQRLADGVGQGGDLEEMIASMTEMMGRMLGRNDARRVAKRLEAGGNAQNPSRAATGGKETGAAALTGLPELDEEAGLVRRPAGGGRWRLSPDGGLWASVEGKVAFRDGPTGKPLARGTDALDDMTSLMATYAFSADGARFAATHAGGGAGVWETASGARVFLQLGHRGAVQCLALDAGGARLATGGADGVVLVWNVATGAALAGIAGFDPALDRLAFCRAGRSPLLAVSDKHSLTLLDAVKLAPRARVVQKDIGAGREIRGVAAGADGGTLAIGFNDGAVALLDVAGLLKTGAAGAGAGGKLKLGATPATPEDDEAASAEFAKLVRERLTARDGAARKELAALRAKLPKHTASVVVRFHGLLAAGGKFAEYAAHNDAGVELRTFLLGVSREPLVRRSLLEDPRYASRALPPLAALDRSFAEWFADHWEQAGLADLPATIDAGLGHRFDVARRKWSKP